MIFPQAMMHDAVWMDRLGYEDAEEHYQLFLNKNLTVQITSSHAKTDELAPVKERSVPDSNHVAKLEEENKSMKKLIEDLSKQVAALELRVGKLEGSTPTPSATPATTPAPTPAAPKKEDDDDDDDDFDMFGDDDEDEDEEETEEDRKKKEALVQKYNEKKSKKPALIAKSSIILDVKPWEDTTDLVEMEKNVRTIEMDGLVWGQSKLIPLAYGIKKLQISCVVEDEKVGSDILTEEIEKFEDLVQSVDIAAFNKI